MKTLANSAWTLVPLSCLFALALVVSVSGCGADSATPLEASVEDAADPAKVAAAKKAEKAKQKAAKPKETAGKPASVRPVKELAAAIEVALTDTAATSQSDPNRDRVQREAALRRQIELGVKSASDLIANYQEDKDAVAKAWRSKLTLLYRGAREELANFADQLEAASIEVSTTEFKKKQSTATDWCSAFGICIPTRRFMKWSPN
jgi:hypothetical protein